MGKLSKALGALSRSKPGPRCGVAVLLADLEGADRIELEGTLKDVALMSSTISKAISEAFSAQLSQQTIARHRRGICSCRG